MGVRRIGDNFGKKVDWEREYENLIDCYFVGELEEK